MENVIFCAVFDTATAGINTDKHRFDPGVGVGLMFLFWVYISSSILVSSECHCSSPEDLNTLGAKILILK